MALLFLDDIGVKGPYSRYDNREARGLPGVRQFILKHIQNLDRVLTDIERFDATIAAEKSVFCASGIKIVGFICDHNGRYFNKDKVRKICVWKKYNNVTEARAFLGICIYF